MVTRYDEPVEMIGHFARGKVQPCRFRWHGHVYHIASVSSQWENREGTYPLFHYVVRTREEDVYELHLNISDLTWTLDFHYSENS
ncbi:MAG: hypothetical protein K8S15_11330 [Candidatus Aegiribacteria sp.]|nr:hypothetical protein [Candidatus Aegiribacteria sp.]